MSLLNFFPFQSIRNVQKEVLKQIEEALNCNYKYIFLEAPTGFGKSPIAITLAKYFQSSHICTSTKELQNQYIKNFSFIFSVMGKSNFKCIVKEEAGYEENCEYGPCMSDENYNCAFKTKLSDYRIHNEGSILEKVELDSKLEDKYVKSFESTPRLTKINWRPCYYYDQKWKGLKHSHSIYNYKYFFSDFFYIGNIQKRGILIFDEAHTLESEISDFKSFSISKESIKYLVPTLKFPSQKEFDIQTWIQFCDQLRNQLLDFIDSVAIRLENNQGNQKLESDLIDAIMKEKNIELLLNDIVSDKENWIVSNVYKDQDGSIKRVILTPLDVSKYFKPIFDLGRVNLLMSATILSKEYLCKVTGIDPKEVKYITVNKSEFPVKNRPIYLMDVAWLSSKTMIQSLPLIAKSVNNLMSIHKKDKGIIHTTSYAQIDYIKNNISKENSMRLIETNPNISRNQILQKHFENTKPTVLISPSMYLGLDLKDNYSRFQIIVKTPYPDLTDKKISIMKQRDQLWYYWNTILRIVQAYGRSIRNDKDYANTYILDSNVSYLLRNNKDMFPKWFLDAIVQK